MKTRLKPASCRIYKGLWLPTQPWEVSEAADVIVAATMVQTSQVTGPRSEGLPATEPGTTLVWFKAK